MLDVSEDDIFPLNQSGLDFLFVDINPKSGAPELFAAKVEGTPGASTEI